jgi:hypothetical protein
VSGTFCAEAWTGVGRDRHAERPNATTKPSSGGSRSAGCNWKKRARRQNALIVFENESGVSLLPSVRATWAPRGHTPVLRHQFGWKRLSLAGPLAYEWPWVATTLAVSGPDFDQRSECELQSLADAYRRGGCDPGHIFGVRVIEFGDTAMSERKLAGLLRVSVLMGVPVAQVKATEATIAHTSPLVSPLGQRGRCSLALLARGSDRARPR